MKATGTDKSDITELLQSLKAAAEKATPGRIGDRIDGSGSIKYQCFGNDGSLVLQTDHKNMEYGFIGPNSDADELFFRECSPENVLALVEALEKAQQQTIELQQGCENDPHVHEIIDLKERIDNLESFRTAYMEWGEKTDWVQTDKRFDVLKPWGKHRADVMKKYIDYLELAIELEREKSRRVMSRISELENQLKAAENNEIDARCRIAELEESHAQVIQSRDHYKRMSEEGLKQLAESRTVTVKLPSLNPEMFNGDVMFGYHKAQKEAVEFCAAAGIKVEAE